MESKEASLSLDRLEGLIRQVSHDRDMANWQGVEGGVELFQVEGILRRVRKLLKNEDQRDMVLTVLTAVATRQDLVVPTGRYSAKIYHNLKSRK